MMDPASDTTLSDALRWAMESAENPSLAAADWLVRDISPQYAGAYALLSDPEAPFEHIQAAKDAFKTMRIVGETTADRQLAVRLYAATIAVGMVRFSKRISRQSNSALDGALKRVEDDHDLPESLRETAALARAMLQAKGAE